MMVAEKAIDHVEKCIEYFRTAARSMKETTILREEFEDRAVALETAIEALKKQVAKKPEPSRVRGVKCPSCGNEFPDPDFAPRFCGVCGQMLDRVENYNGEQ